VTARPSFDGAHAPQLRGSPEDADAVSGHVARVRLRSSGNAWIDASLGGLPAGRVVTVTGQARTGKSTLGLSFALAGLDQGAVCIVTTDTPQAVLELAATRLERDLRPDVRARRVTILSLAAHFDSKVQSLGGAEAPLRELQTLVRERGIRTVLFDSFDPLVTWIPAGTAKPSIRATLELLAALDATCVCTMRAEGLASSPGATELVAASAGAIELSASGPTRTLVVRNATWCHVENMSTRCEFVQGRGLVATGSAPSERHAPVATKPRPIVRRPATRTPKPELPRSEVSVVTLLHALPTEHDTVPRLMADGGERNEQTVVVPAQWFNGRGSP
jgi:KaiC/GvpD/RAD55 family RecA-like ATPase